MHGEMLEGVTGRGYWQIFFLFLNTHIGTLSKTSNLCIEPVFGDGVGCAGVCTGVCTGMCWGTFILNLKIIVCKELYPMSTKTS